MRVADSVATETLIGNLRRSFSRIDRFQRDLSTGVTIHNASGYKFLGYLFRRLFNILRPCVKYPAFKTHSCPPSL